MKIEKERLARRAASPICLVFIALCGMCQIAGAVTPGWAASPAMEATVPQTGVLTSGPVDARLLVARLYASTPNAGSVKAPIWLGHADRVQRALSLLRNAPAHGLDPDGYGVDELTRRFERRDAGAAFESDLSIAMLQFIADLHFGRTTPDYRLAPEAVVRFDPVEHLLQAIEQDRLEQAVQEAEPAIPLYHRVKASLAQYRQLARQMPQWPALPAPTAAATLTAGAAYSAADTLRERLRLLGDLESSSPGRPDSGGNSAYTSELAAAVKRFQARHGLEPDGKLGEATRAALSVPPSRRVLQLELTLERLRWLAPQRRGRMVVVNLPTYRLLAFDNTQPAAEQPLEMRVIVGTAARTPTPLFIGQMRYLEFNPYWNVPRSIEIGEIAPSLARNPSYLRQHDMELIATDGRPVPAATAAQLAALRAGTVRVRQRPGPRNVLGAVKFAMPNPMNIYLHSTAAQALFGQTRRDLSHGCIRVERPAELAQFVLADPARWDATSVAAAMAAGRSRTVRLPQAIPVVLFYATALTDRRGRVLFADDIYGRDETLLRALRVR